MSHSVWERTWPAYDSIGWDELTRQLRWLLCAKSYLFYLISQG